VPMAAGPIILTTLNARYSHASLGLRYLAANMGELGSRTVICEYTINDPAAVVVESLLGAEPCIIGFGVYIWNLRETTRIVRLIKTLAPHITVVIGGPEVSHDYHDEPLVALADVLAVGEADLAFAAICRTVLNGGVPERIVQCAKPDLATLRLPYALYTEEDLRQRLTYVEASRGCPFTCEFCLSSIEEGVRAFPLETLLAELESLILRGCRTFKFVDRTFNLSPRTSAAILDFFLHAYVPGMFLHFEMVPDRLPEALKSLISAFPRGAIQFEIGIQSFTPRVGELISRRMDRARTVDNLTWLTRSSGVHVHADLIIGLPGETMASLAESFDALWWLHPGEIQVGILKLLKGTPLVRHREAFAMVYNPEPPYDLLASRDFDFPTMQRLKRFARYSDLYANSGRFPESLELLIARSGGQPFAALVAFSDWLWSRDHQEHAISLKHLYELILIYLDTLLPGGGIEAIRCLAHDFINTQGNPTGSLKGLPEALRLAVEDLLRQARSAPPAPAAHAPLPAYRLAGPGGVSQVRQP